MGLDVQRLLVPAEDKEGGGRRQELARRAFSSDRSLPPVRGEGREGVGGKGLRLQCVSEKVRLPTATCLGC